MKKITVKRISPKELPEDLVFRLNQKYHTELGEFVVIVDDTNEIMYVNKKLSIPKKDIDGFLKVIAFPYYWVVDDEAPTEQFLEYVYEKYGFGACRALLDSHSWRLNKEEKQRAKEQAKTIIPLIEEQVRSDNPIVKFDENLLHEVYCAGFNRKERTAKNICGFSSIYLFYLGYLMGAGMLKGGTK